MAHSSFIGLFQEGRLGLDLTGSPGEQRCPLFALTGRLEATLVGQCGSRPLHAPYPLRLHVALDDAASQIRFNVTSDQCYSLA